MQLVAMKLRDAQDDALQEEVVKQEQTSASAEAVAA